MMVKFHLFTINSAPARSCLGFLFSRARPEIGLPLPWKQNNCNYPIMVKGSQKIRRSRADVTHSTHCAAEEESGSLDRDNSGAEIEL